jgi:hypothetical protein
MGEKIRSHIRSNVIGYVALFVALSGTAYATHPGGANTISSGDIINGEVRSADIGSANVQNSDLAGSAVTGGKIAAQAVQSSDVLDNSLTGADIGNGAITPDEIGSIPAVRADEPGSLVEGVGCQNGQSIPSGTVSIPVLQFTDEDFDTADMHPSGCVAGNTRVTAPRSGIYQVSAGVTWTNNTTGTRFLGLRVNGSGDLTAAASRVPAIADIPHQSVSTLIALGEGDFVEAVVVQNSGSELNVCDKQTSHCHLAMHWVVGRE